MDIKVSVLMITYNHECYIEQAVNSVLMQQVDFPYELIIGEDCSSDDTYNILLDFKNNYPDIIRLLSSEQNLGPNKNIIRTYQACKGEYIALLEGDDYWISEHKLQKQVDLLDARPDVTVCYHNAQVIYENGSRMSHNYFPPEHKGISTIEDLLFSRYFLPTASVMFRNSLINDFPEWFFQLRLADRALHIMNAQHGGIEYLNETLSVYRKHSTGIWSGLGYIEILCEEIIFFEIIDKYLDDRYCQIVQKKMEGFWEALADALVEYGVNWGYGQFNLKNFKSIFNQCPSAMHLDHRWKARVLGRIYERLLFSSFSDYDLKKVRYCWFRLIIYSPKSVLNRGVWSIGLEAFLGQRITQILRKFIGYW